MKFLNIIILIIFYLALTNYGFSQNTTILYDAVFCGKVGESGKDGGNYIVDQLRSCDLKIVPMDSNFTVSEFRLTLIKINNANVEEKIKGNTIPEGFRNEILTKAKLVYLEYIRAVNKIGQTVGIKPIAVRIQH